MEVAVAVLLFFVAATSAAIKLGMGATTRAVIGLVAALVVLL